MAIVSPKGHLVDIDSASFSPDGKRIVSYSRMGQEIKIWDTYTGRLLGTIPNRFNPVFISRTIETFATVTSDSTAKISTVSGRLISTIALNKNFRITDCQFGPNDETVLLNVSSQIGSIGRLLIADTKNGRIINEFNYGTDRTRASYIQGNSKIVLVNEINNAISIWDYEKSKIFNGITTSATSRVQEPVIIFSGNGRNIFFIHNRADTSELIIKDYEQDKVLYRTSYPGFIISVNPGPGNDQVVASIVIIGNTSAILKTIDLNKGAEVSSQTQPLEKAFQEENNQLSPDKEKLLVQEYELLEIRYAGTNDLIKKLNIPHLSTCKWSTDSKMVLAVVNERFINCHVLVIDASTGEQIADLTNHAGYLPYAKFYKNDSQIIYCNNNFIRTIDWKTGIAPSALYEHSTQVDFLKVDEKNNKVISTSDGTVKVWDINTSRVVKTLQNGNSSVRNAFFFNGQKNIISATYDSAAIWDYTSKNIVRSLFSQSVNEIGQRAEIMSVAVNAQNNRMIILTSTGDISLGVLKETSVSLLKVFDVFYSKSGIKLAGRFNYAAFSPDGKTVIATSVNGPVILWDAMTGNQLNKLDYQWPVEPKFSEAGDKIIFLSDDNRSLNILPHDLNPKAEIKLPCKRNAFFQFADLSRSGKKAVTMNSDGEIQLWDVITGKVIHQFNEPNSVSLFAQLSKDETKLLTLSRTNEIKVYSCTENKLLFSYYNIDSSGYLAQVENGYYAGDKEAVKHLHYVSDKLKIISFEQLDIKYNRPDIVLASMGNKDTGLIRSYKRAYEKRIKLLGIDTSALYNSTVTIESIIANEKEIGYEQKSETLTLKLKGRTTNGTLDRFNVWINDVPVYGQRGINIRARNKSEFDTTVTVLLTPGTNRIEMSFTGTNGTESYRMPFNVNYVPLKPQPEIIRFVGIGIDQFIDARNNLKYCAKDIRDLAIRLKEKYGKNLIIDTLLNENVTRANVAALKRNLETMKENDKIILAYSGHGMFSREYDYYLSTYQINFDNPAQNGLPYEDLENLLDSIRPRKKLMMIDACHSGEVDKEELQRMAAVQKETNKDFNLVGLRKGNHDPLSFFRSSVVGWKNSIELMKDIFANVKSGTGATIIAASGGTQYASEDSTVENGIFTSSVLDILQKDRTVTVGQLKREVSELVIQKTGGLQQPTTRNEILYADWRVW